MSKLIFETDKYKIKTFTMDNFDYFCEINQDPIVAKYVNHNDGKPKTFKECIDKYEDITTAQNKYGYSYWAIYNKDDDFLGQCGVIRTWLNENNFCYAYKKKYWGKGIGTEVGNIVKSYVFDNFKDVNELSCSAFAENIASVKLLEKIGFKLIKTEKEFGKDLHFFKLTRKDYEEKII